MPSFNFSTIVKKKDNKKQVKTKGVYDIIEKKISGVVFIDINGKYSVNNIEIAPECFTCQGATKLYYQGLQDKQRVMYIRDSIDKNIACSIKHYLPFTVGCCVIGNKVENIYSHKIYFYIKKVFINYDNIDSQRALNFYREHYEEIIKNKEIMR